MSKVVNLRTVRKQRTRDAGRRKAARAEPDAAEAERVRAETDRERRALDAHRRDEPER